MPQGAYFMSPQMQFASVYGWSTANPPAQSADEALPKNPVGSALEAMAENAPRFREVAPGKTLTTTTVKRESGRLAPWVLSAAC